MPRETDPVLRETDPELRETDPVLRPAVVPVPEERTAEEEERVAPPERVTPVNPVEGVDARRTDEEVPRAAEVPLRRTAPPASRDVREIELPLRVAPEPRET